MREIFFKSEVHKQRFLTTMQEIRKIYDGKLDQEYASAVYILTSSNAMWQSAKSEVRSDGIGIDEILDDNWSGGQEVLIQLAGNLFNSQTHLDPIELMRLDETNFNIAIGALNLRRESYHIDDFPITVVDATVVNTTNLLIKDVYALKPAMPKELAATYMEELEEAGEEG